MSQQPVVFRRHSRAIYSAAALALVGLAALAPRLVDGIEDPAWPLRAAVLPPPTNPEPSPVLVVRFPRALPAGDLAAGLAALDAAGAKALLIHVDPAAFPADPAGRLAAALRATKKAVLSRVVDPITRDVRAPPLPLLQGAAGTGYTAARALPGGGAAVSLVGGIRDTSQYGVLAETLRVYLGLAAYEMEASPTRIRLPRAPLPLTLDLPRAGDLLVLTEGRRVPTAPWGDAAAAAGKLVVLAHEDERPGVTPTDLQAAAAAAALAGDFPEPVPELLAELPLAAFALGLAGLGAYLTPLPMAFAAALTAGLWYAVSLGLLATSQLLLPLIRPLVLFALIALAAVVRHTLRTVVGLRRRVADPAAAGSAQASLDLGMRLLRQGQVDESLKYFQKVANLESELKDQSRYFLALVLLRRGDTGTAVSLVEALDFGALPEAQVDDLATELERRGELKTAHTILRSVVTTNTGLRGTSTLGDKLVRLESRLASATDDEVALQMAQRVVDPRYTDLKLIGVGGMGYVFRAEDSDRDGETVALKMLSPYFANQAAYRERFLAEAEGLSTLRHDRVATCYDVFGANLPYYSMEFLDGVSLKEILAGGGTVGVREAKIWVLQACEGLAFAHGRGVVHRDIKPDNLFLDSKGSLKVIDFGIARFSEAEGAPRTKTGQVLGTPRYMPPEQLHGLPVDHRADIYSLGKVLRELTSGSCDLDGPPPPEPVRPVVDRACAVNPEHRYPTTEAFAAEVERIPE